MNIEGAFSVYSTSGIQIARFLFELNQTTSREDIAARFGFHPQWLGSILKLGRDLFGEKRASKQRQEAIAVAEENCLGIEILRVTNAALSKLSKEASISREALRKRLYQWAQGKTVLEAKAEAAAQVVALNNECGKPPQVPAARISRNTDADGMRHLHASLHDNDASAISEKLNSLARHLRRHNPDLTYSHALALALKQSILRHDAAEIPRREGLILLPADGLTHIGDGMLATTDGALIPAKDLAEHLLADLGYAVVYALNKEGIPEPVDLFRTKRYANTKQRIILTADQLTCADPNCHRLANNCEIHHLQAWQFGGETNLKNLVACCSTHNKLNDDNPLRPNNGHYIRMPRTGRAGLQPPSDDAQPRASILPLARKSGRYWACQHFGIAS
ncbi:Hypothetical protein Cp262_0769 [Corynebacterium pseudotuberculosis]|uniref:HNH endonuclease signature motif containing protein n=1 Tax=Corynebacterium pseudotuberculosis TaxID=1719 RepID=UPI00065E4709|nr:HNH endonuclease signature motif containing protein [Corynebacterium pseudotuberculosis]AKP08435.1 Hypothetical protein Cp262_0769 [Corynebacterium pseudotuberculosis]